jgi:PAS domain S-box-containing protein
LTQLRVYAARTSCPAWSREEPCADIHAIHIPMSWYTYFSGIISGLFLLSGLFSLFLYSRRIERGINLPYFVLACCLAGVLMCSLQVTGSGDLAVKLFFDRVVNTLFGIAGVAFLFMLSEMTGYRARVPIILLTVGLTVFVALAWMLPYGISYSEIHGVASYTMLWGELRSRIDGEAGAANVYVVVLLFAILLYAVRAVAIQARHGEVWYARLLIVVIVIGISGIIVDSVLIHFRMGEIGIVDDIGFIALVFLIGHRNFTNIIRSKEMIRESRERFACLTEAAFEGIGLTDDGSIIDVNEQLARMLGYESSELIGRPVLTLIAPHHREKVLQYSTGDEASYEHDALCKDGSFVPVEVRVKNVQLTGRSLRVAAIRDMSVHRRTEQQNMLLAQALKSVRDCITITDESARIIFVNDAFLQTYGYSEEEILGKNVSMIRSPNVAQRSDHGVFSHMREGSWHGVLLNMRKDGTEFPVELWTSVVRDAAGHPLAHVGVARDVSERRRSERALIEAKERAERSDRLKDAFIANISHEIRTPLNIILGYTSLISESMDKRATDEEMQYFDSVQRGAQRLMRTVDLILSISRLQVGDVEIDPVLFDLAYAAREITSDYRSAAKKKQLELVFESIPGDTFIIADEYCVAQSLHNLIDNALKYTAEGSITVRVERTNDERVCVAVVDTGIGISEEYLPTMFKPYTQEDSGYTRGYEGIGLGLSLVKRYSELNEATVEIESIKGAGTTAALFFAAAVRSDGGSNTIALSRDDDDPGGTTAGTAAKVRALLVEDETLTIEFMRTILAQECDLIEARSADEAMAALSHCGFDIIFMDISLSGDRDGLELTQELKASPAFGHIPVIAITAHGFAQDRQRCLDAGCDAYMCKPVCKEELMEVVKTLLPSGHRFL